MAIWYCDDRKIPYHLGWKEIEFTEPYPLDLWRCDDERLPYKITWKDIEVQPPYPALAWLCDDRRLPYKYLWKEITAYTTLNFPKAEYKAQVITELVYKSKTQAENVNLTTRVFEDKNKVYAYRGVNKQLTVVSTKNTTVIWFDNMFAFNDSTVTIKLGQFTHGVQDKIQLFLSDTIPTEWDLGDLYDQVLATPNAEVSFNVVENVTKYMGVGFAHATVGIVSVYINDLRVI